MHNQWGIVMPYGFLTMAVLVIARVTRLRVAVIYGFWLKIKAFAKTCARKLVGMSSRSPR
jgi:hypothetical protein